MAHFRILTEAELDARLTCLELAQWVAWHAVERDAILRTLGNKEAWIDPFSQSLGL